jgi:hypothetical protein
LFFFFANAELFSMTIVPFALLRKILHHFQYLFQLRSFSKALAFLVSRCFNNTHFLQTFVFCRLCYSGTSVIFSSSKDSSDSLSVSCKAIKVRPPQGRGVVELTAIKLPVRTSYRLQLSFFWLYLRGSQPSVCPALLCNPRRNQVAPTELSL